MAHSHEHRSDGDGGSASSGLFTTTHWSVILAAGDPASPHAQEALDQLCQTYWFPVYAFVRKSGYNQDDAEDLTQGFFARLLAKNSLQAADRAKGRFRSYLLGAARHFLLNEQDRARCLKRGGRCVIRSLDETAESKYQREPAHDITAEKLFERQWALALLERAMGRLQAECAAEGKGDLFDCLAGVLSGEREGCSYQMICEQLKLTASAAHTAAHRLRQRYADLLRLEIAQTVEGPAEVEAEIQHLFSAVSLPGSSNNELFQ